MADQNTTSSGKALRHLRAMAGLTLQQVAFDAGTSIAYLSKVERGQLNPTDEYVGNIASRLSLAILRKSGSAPTQEKPAVAAAGQNTNL